MPDELPTIDDIDQKVGRALTVRGRPAPLPVRVVLRRVTLGSLRMLDDPTGGPLADLFTAIFPSGGPAQQAAQRIVDYWISGVNNSPPFPQRPQMRQLVDATFHSIGEPPPGTVEIAALVDIGIGLIKDRFPNTHSAPTPVSEAIVRRYAIGV